jgi:hypothetical protein
MSNIITSTNVAVGKPASQSSLSAWSTENDASGAVSGMMPETFGFHTGVEAAPWWMVDLLQLYRIDRIVIHNRLDSLQELARSCLVDISEDGTSWVIVHAGLAYFSGGALGVPLNLPLGGRASARFVRVSLAEEGCLHLAQVEVFVNAGDQIRRLTGLHALPFLGEFPATPPYLSYWLEGPIGAGLDAGIIGLKLTFIGRLGNQMIQIINAVCIARRLGIRYIIVLEGGMIRLQERFSHSGIEFIARTEDAEMPGLFLTGNFFLFDQLRPLVYERSSEERYQIVHDIILPGLMEKLPAGEDIKYEDELTIHMRSGDLFAGSAVDPGYVQPPLAYYTLLVRNLTTQKRISRVRLVFEDRANPCVDGLIAFLKDADIPLRVQSGTLAEDVVALVDSPMLVFGHGTFGVAIALLSRRIETLFCFNGYNRISYIDVPSIAKVISVNDRASSYIKFGTWRNTPEQRQLMLEYPESALEIEE